MILTWASDFFSVCDMLDALTVDRPYRTAITFEEAKPEILSARNTFFDPGVIDSFIRTEEDIRAFISKILF